MDDDSSCLCDIDTIRHIPEEKKSLYPTHRRMICIDEFSQILTDLDESIWERYTRTRLDDTILDHTQSPPFFFEESKTNCRKSWIYTEHDHDLSIGRNIFFTVLYEKIVDFFMRWLKNTYVINHIMSSRAIVSSIALAVSLAWWSVAAQSPNPIQSVQTNTQDRAQVVMYSTHPKVWYRCTSQIKITGTDTLWVSTPGPSSNIQPALPNWFTYKCTHSEEWGVSWKK